MHVKKEKKQTRKHKPSRSVNPNNDRQYKCIFICKQKRSGQALSHCAKYQSGYDLMHLKLSLSLQLYIFTRSAEQTGRLWEQMLPVGSDMGHEG